jgi:hypothetical protein
LIVLPLPATTTLPVIEPARISFRSAIETSGGRIVILLYFLAGKTDFGAGIARWAASHPANGTFD